MTVLEGAAGMVFWLVALVGAVLLAVLGRGPGRPLGLSALGLVLLGAVLSLLGGVVGPPALGTVGQAADLLGVALLVVALVVASRPRPPERSGAERA